MGVPQKRSVYHGKSQTKIDDFGGAAVFGVLGGDLIEFSTGMLI